MAQMAEVNAGDILRSITVTVRVRGLWLVRLRLSLPVFWLAAKIAGVGLKVEADDDVC